MKLELNTSQKMLINQKLIQSTMILQMSTAELFEYVNHISEENPVLEVKNDYYFDYYKDTKKKSDYVNTYDEQNRIYYKEEKDEENDNSDWKFKQSTEKTLFDFLLEQIMSLKISKNELSVCIFIAGCINNAGYIYLSDSQIADMLNTDINLVKKAINIIQSLEPNGVCAHNLSECLLIQINKLKIDNTLLKTIIKNYIELLGKNQIRLIAKKTGAKIADVNSAVDIIKNLNPKPGNGFLSEHEIDYVIPDAIIDIKNGICEININDFFSAEINISDFYMNILKYDYYTDDAKEFVYSKIRQAEWISKCILKRKETLYKIIKAVTEKQYDFFQNGKGHISPLLLSDVASYVKIHESTVSRTIKGKYIQCKYGVYPLSYFFRQAVTEKFGEGITQEKIQTFITNVIDKEDKSAPLSDRKIAEELLSKHGIDISRRTVAKYRGILGIKGISGRRE